MDFFRLRTLLNQYFDNSISRADCKVLLDYLSQVDDSTVNNIIDEMINQEYEKAPFEESQKNRVYSRLIAGIKSPQTSGGPVESGQVHTLFSQKWLRLAAMLLIGFSVTIYIYRLIVLSTPEQVQISHPTDTHDILLPDGNQAILELADGRTLVLSDSVDGILARQSGVEIRRIADGSILYDTKSTSLVGENTQYNTFSTPKGHSYKLLLPDGTKVWLNTASSVRFPVAFTGKDRSVSLTGEAYFEVAHDSSKPFLVEAQGSVIRVLGTHFNVSAFEDEARVTTTLLEGSVDVSNGNHHVLLKPGEQAEVDAPTGEIRQSPANVRAVTAWREGYFRFDDEPIERIVSKISRWYDIEAVEYKGDFSDRFTGTFQRSKGVSQLFDHLEKLAPIRFEIKERGIIIMK